GLKGRTPLSLHSSHILNCRLGKACPYQLFLRHNQPHIRRQGWGTAVKNPDCPCFDLPIRNRKPQSVSIKSPSMRSTFDCSVRVLLLWIWTFGADLVLRAEAGSLPLRIKKVSTTRITQITGGYDPEGKPFLNDTVPWRVAGVDLGANTEYNGRLYFFFGDVVPTRGGSWPPYDSDLIAYTQDSSPEPNGFRLTPVPRDGAFYPFTVHLPGRPPSAL